MLSLDFLVVCGGVVWAGQICDVVAAVVGGTGGIEVVLRHVSAWIAAGVRVRSTGGACVMVVAVWVVGIVLSLLLLCPLPAITGHRSRD